MKILLTGGGTAGHITPNIALLPELRKQGFNISYIGTKSGMEYDLIKKENIPFYSITAGKLRRYFDFKNVTDILKIIKGFFQSIYILHKVKPNIVFSKGGFVSCPVVWAAWLSRIPVVIHESDMTPGLANKLSLPFAKKICITFPETKKYINPSKVVSTGIPVRESLLAGNIETGRKICSFSSDKPVLLVIGGSQGSGFLNSLIVNSLNRLLEKFQICHICGKGQSKPELKDLKGYTQFEYVSEELAHLLSISDMIVSRAGATAIFEIISLNKPSLLIPLSKKASRGDQILNAKSFETQGFAKVLEEEDIKSENLFIDMIETVFKEREVYIRNINKSNLKQGVNEVISTIMSSIKC